MVMPAAGWKVVGNVTERREIKTKTGTVFMHMIKVASMGITLEVSVEEAVYNGLAPGESVQAEGSFEEFAGRLKLVGRKVVKLNEKAPA